MIPFSMTMPVISGAGYLERELGRPQVVEGVCVGDDVAVVQARPQQGLGPPQSGAG
jgi:hypothetical protein